MVSVNNKRKERDLMKLMMSNYDVTVTEESKPYDFYVTFKGPKESFYEGGIWKIHVMLPDQYPYKSPSIGFQNKVFHPNVDFISGTVCLDVINQTWSPMYDLINIFEVFLPQLLLYPNPTDPLNGEAASLLLKDSEKYQEKVKECVKKYASEKNEKIEQSNNSKTEEIDIKSKNKESDGEQSSILSNASLSQVDESEG